MVDHNLVKNVKTDKRKKNYDKPVLTKHEQLREVTMASKGRNNCSTCQGGGPSPSPIS